MIKREYLVSLNEFNKYNRDKGLEKVIKKSKKTKNKKKKKGGTRR